MQLSPIAHPAHAGQVCDKSHPGRHPMTPQAKTPGYGRTKSVGSDGQAGMKEPDSSSGFPRRDPGHSPSFMQQVGDRSSLAYRDALSLGGRDQDVIQFPAGERQTGRTEGRIAGALEKAGQAGTIGTYNRRAREGESLQLF